MRKSDILNDNDINTISVENIDKDFDQINIISDVKESKLKAVLRVLSTSLLTLILCSVILVGIYTYINMRVVIGDVSGAVVNIAGISIVENSYSPDKLIHERSTVYYSDKPASFITNLSDLSVGKVVSVNETKVYLQGDKSGKTDAINKSQVPFALNNNG